MIWNCEKQKSIESRVQKNLGGLVGTEAFSWSLGQLLPRLSGRPNGWLAKLLVLIGEIRVHRPASFITCGFTLDIYGVFFSIGQLKCIFLTCA